MFSKVLCCRGIRKCLYVGKGIIFPLKAKRSHNGRGSQVIGMTYIAPDVVRQVFLIYILKLDLYVSLTTGRFKLLFNVFCHQ